MQWFRLYDDLLDDPKAQQLSPVLFKHWINILCLANKGSVRGVLPGVSDIAFRLRLSKPKAEAVIRELMDLGLLDRHEGELIPHNWNERQKRSDDVTARTAKHKQERLRERSPEQVGDVLDTDTDKTRKEQEEPSLSSPPETVAADAAEPETAKPTLLYPAKFESFWREYPTGHGSKKVAYGQWRRLKPDERARLPDALNAWKSCERWIDGYVKAAELWIRDRLWDQPPPPPKPRANGITHRKPKGPDFAAMAIAMREQEQTG